MACTGHEVDICAAIGRRTERRVKDNTTAGLKARNSCFDGIIHGPTGAFANKSQRIQTDRVKTVGTCMVDLSFRRQRNATRNHSEPIYLAGQRKIGMCADQAFGAPRAEQSIFDPRGAGDKSFPTAGGTKQLSPAASCVASESTSMSRIPSEADASSSIRASASGAVMATRSASRTGRRVCFDRWTRKVRLVHRGHRMAAHDGMAVDAKDPALVSGKEIAECRIALQLRRADDDGHDGLPEYRSADFDRLADIADFGAGIEGRADLVVADVSAERIQPLESARKVLLHPCGGLAAACPGNADCAAIPKAREQFRRRNVEEEHGRHAVRCQCLHDIGGAGKVIPVIADERSIHRGHAPLPSLNLAIEAASSG